MNSAALLNMVVLTLTNPAEAARRLLAMRFGPDVLWLAFFLAVILNALVQSLSGFVLPLINPEVQQLAEPVSRTLFVSVAAILISVVIFLLVGRVLGGSGSFNDFMTLVVWLQILQIAGQAIVLVSVSVLPFLFLPASLAMLVLSLYITLHFINEAHEFKSLGKSFLVILLSGLVAIPFVLWLSPV
ncbi:Yip1 family protein [uncultured Ruegeria sp.]|uniref:Yip1 family protein n=1 Tax=uncultured Ruegeria sp. TaxID=259304 RepID=UPI00260E784B|nr:Yip1 family protein [uncultured Ruegeria sp.]